MDMDMGPTSNSSMDMVMMVPYFHFTGGDHLFFESWRPTSTGAIAGACIGLALLALLDRWFAATRGILDSRWRHKGLALISRTACRSGKKSLPSSSGTSEKSIDLKTSIDEGSRQLETPLSIYQTYPPRTTPPFIAAHDLPRGIVHAAQSLLGYILMLAVMTFNAAYVISIVLGLGIGEVIFGRMGGGRSAIH